MKDFITAEKAREMVTSTKNEYIKSILEHLNANIIEEANNGETDTVYCWLNRENSSIQTEIKKFLKDKGYTIEEDLDGRSIYIYW